MHDNLGFVIVIVAIVFLAKLANTWLKLQHRERMREPAMAGSGRQGADQPDLRSVADRLERRVEALETILDAEAPGWRKKHDQ